MRSRARHLDLAASGPPPGLDRAVLRRAGALIDPIAGLDEDAHYLPPSRRRDGHVANAAASRSPRDRSDVLRPGRRLPSQLLPWRPLGAGACVPLLRPNSMKSPAATSRRERCDDDSAALARRAELLSTTRRRSRRDHLLVRTVFIVPTPQCRLRTGHAVLPNNHWNSHISPDRPPLPPRYPGPYYLS